MFNLTKKFITALQPYNKFSINVHDPLVGLEDDWQLCVPIN